MSAGLPGLGLGGLFFIFSALLAPGPELWRTLRGRSSLAAWRVVGRQFAQAAAMIAGIDLTIRLLYLGLSASGLRDAPPVDSGTVLPVTLIGITSALLVALLVVAKLAELSFRARSAELPGVPASLPRPAPLRAASVGGTVALAWFALLAAGASELSPAARSGKGSPAPDHAGASLPAVPPGQTRSSRSGGPAQKGDETAPDGASGDRTDRFASIR